jgi:cobalt-zinc-cadmium efflux system protein
MAHAHHHDSHRALKEQGSRDLIWALAITALWFLIELVGGIYSNSLALLADAAHMLTDLAALALSLFAQKIAFRPATHQKTYGYQRAEILAALANGVFLVVVAIYIFYQAYRRFITVPEVKSGPMLIVAATGLVANLVTAALLYRSQRDSLNIRGAFLHVAGDTLGSIGAILAGSVMVLWQWYLADPVVSVVVAVLVLISSWQLVRESVDVLLEGTPSDLNIPEILADLGSVRGVRAVHDLHVWSITSGMPAMSCHAVLTRDVDPSSVLSELSRVMRDKYHIDHTTIQIEPESLIEAEAILRPPS